MKVSSDKASPTVKGQGCREMSHSIYWNDMKNTLFDTGKICLKCAELKMQIQTAVRSVSTELQTTEE